MLAVVTPPGLALIDGAAAASATDWQRQQCDAGLPATLLIFRTKRKNIQNPATLRISSRYTVKLRPRSSSLLAPRKPFSVTPPSPEKNTTSTTTSPSDDTEDNADTIPWTPELSSAMYRVDGWGPPYFSVNSSGNITVHPYGSQTLPHQQIDLLDVVNTVTSATASSSSTPLPLPILIQFPDVLKHRLESLQSAFDLAILSHSYHNHYQGVFPVKTNQNRHVVDDIVQFGSPFRFGLEAGSKPELLLAMSSLCKENYLTNPDPLLVCNGFKDREYVSLSLAARKHLGLDTVIVLEQEDELDTVVEVSRELGVRLPVIGIRAKMRTAHSGHFGSTSGENGKFGLGVEQILRVVKRLESLGMLDCLQLLHFHIGSQIPSAEVVADVVSEGAYIYSELVRLGAKSMRVIDVGGGLGIDYDGSKSANSYVSVGYTLQEYADAVVRTVKLVCDKKGVPHPVIVSESGRAIVSHHSVLVFEAFSSTTNTTTTTRSAPSSIMSLSTSSSSIREGLSEEGWMFYHRLWSAALNGDYGTSVYYADRLKQRCVDQFKDGSLRIDQLAAVDALYDDLVSRAHRLGVNNDKDDDDDNKQSQIRTYNVNLSIFNSIPDFWAIGQLFPIIPIHRLDERPKVKGILSDLTCDSDGKIDKFIGGGSSLMLHEVGKKNSNSKYYLGMFLGGAYQEALGGLHNLFGGPSVVRVTKKKINGSEEWPHRNFAVTRAVPGPSCGDVLRAMQHEPCFMFQYIKHRAEELMMLAHHHHHHLGLGNGNGNGNGHVYDDDDVSPNVLLERIARSFNNTPYLVLGKGGIDLINGNNCTYRSDAVTATTDSSEGTVGQEVDDELPNV